MKYSMTREQQRKRNRIKLLSVVIGAMLLIAIALIAKEAVGNRSCFAENTYIQGIDCSGLDVQQAQEKVQDEWNSKNVYIWSFTDEIYTVPIQELGLSFKQDFTARLEGVLKEQPLIGKIDCNERNVWDLVTFDRENVENVLRRYIGNSQETADVPVEFNEQFGEYTFSRSYMNNLIDVTKASEFVISELSNGESNIDISEVAMENIKRLKKELEPINRALKTTVVYHINDTTTVVLDFKTTKDWVYQDDSGNYQLDFDSNLENFVDQLVEKAKYVEFAATGIGNVLVEIQKGAVPQVDKQQEIEWLRQNLGDGKEHDRYLSYIKEPMSIDLSEYIELDITRQMVWMYRNGECILETPCVTGNLKTKHGTPTGIYHLTYKTTSAILRGRDYASYVDYWMPFNKGIGFHDASWRKGVFGGEIYKTSGSHGCVNMPLQAAKTLYQNITSDIPIIIYKS